MKPRPKSIVKRVYPQSRATLFRSEFGRMYRIRTSGDVLLAKIIGKGPTAYSAWADAAASLPSQAEPTK